MPAAENAREWDYSRRKNISKCAERERAVEMLAIRLILGVGESREWVSKQRLKKTGGSQDPPVNIGAISV